MSANTSAVIAAVAASVAAVFSGASLYVTWLREERKWRRDVLLGAHQRYIELSFARSFKAVLAARSRRSADVSRLTELTDEEWELHDEYDSILARIRLLADARTIAAAEQLHDSDQKLVKLSLRSSARMSDADLTVFEQQRQSNRRDKKLMLQAARRGLKIRGGSPISDLYWGTDAAYDPADGAVPGGPEKRIDSLSPTANGDNPQPMV